MDSKTRRATIAEQLRVEGEASIVELAAHFGTSEMTIRRDLDFLEVEGLARRARGGAISVQSRSFEPPILQRAAHMADAKRRIGAAAASLLRENETVIIDVGTTTHELAKAIPDDLAITAITSSLVISTELTTKSRVKTIVTGGVVRHGELSMIGPRAQNSFADLNCDTVFLGVAGVSDVSGLTEYNLDDADVKRSALASGRRVIVLADASKLGSVAFITIAPINVVDLLITNASPDNAVIRRIKDHDVEVLHVEPFEEEKD
ncbi:MAG: DeoR/GlpR family DNA-binding transcription regulator [Acidimicrobiales bacterium]